MNFSLILFLFQFSVVMSDEDIEAFKRIFVMFDKVRDMFDNLNLFDKVRNMFDKLKNV